MGLLFRLAFFVIYALTLTSVFFVYVAIAITLWLVFIIINLNPFKKHLSSYVLTDSMFLMFISMFYISVLGINIGSIYGTTCLPSTHKHPCYVIPVCCYALCSVCYAALDVLSKKMGKRTVQNYEILEFFFKIIAVFNEYEKP